MTPKAVEADGNSIQKLGTSAPPKIFTALDAFYKLMQLSTPAWPRQSAHHDAKKHNSLLVLNHGLDEVSGGKYYRVAAIDGRRSEHSAERKRGSRREEVHLAPNTSMGQRHQRDGMSSMSRLKNTGRNHDDSKKK